MDCNDNKDVCITYINIHYIYQGVIDTLLLLAYTLIIVTANLSPEHGLQ